MERMNLNLFNPKSVIRLLCDNDRFEYEEDVSIQTICLVQYCLVPKMLLPMRTMLLPCCIAS